MTPRRFGCCDTFPKIPCGACDLAFCSTYHLEVHYAETGDAPEGYQWDFRLVELRGIERTQRR